LRTIQDWIVKRQLLGTPGVAEVSGFGGYVKQYEIAVNPDRLRSVNVSIAGIFKALETNNQNTGGAYINKSPNAYFIRTEGLVGGLEDIGKIVIKTNSGIPVLIRDVATVQFGNSNLGIIPYVATSFAERGLIWNNPPPSLEICASTKKGREHSKCYGNEDIAEFIAKDTSEVQGKKGGDSTGTYT
jgi:hypothetical protein